MFVVCVVSARIQLCVVFRYHGILDLSHCLFIVRIAFRAENEGVRPGVAVRVLCASLHCNRDGKGQGKGKGR